MSGRRVLTLLTGLALAGTTAVAVAAADHAVADPAPPQSGNALGFGDDVSGQLGNGTDESGTPTPAPAQLRAGVTAVQVAPGYSHTVALGSDGVVYAWGSNSYGELGNAGQPSDIPEPVTLPAGTTVTSIAAGYLDSFAVTSTGQVYAWGYGGRGELGTGSTASTSTPALVQLPTGVAITTVSAGYAHTLAVGSTGQVYAWGDNSSAQLGDGTGTARLAPALVRMPAGVDATAVSAGYGHSLALTSTGAVYAWGANNRGQLGTGNTTLSAVPVPVDLGGTATAIAAGTAHSVAVLSDGSARAWGDNTYGQLGIGQSSTSVPMATSPTAVAAAGATLTGVAAGFGHTLFRTASGGVLATGDNAFGELGTGDETSSTAPVATVLPSGASAVAVATGSYSLSSFVLVPPIATSTTVTSSADPAKVGTAITFTATVSPTDGGGTVTFTADGTPLCAAVPLSGSTATCTTSALGGGTHAIAAGYSGDQLYASSTGALAGGQPVTLPATTTAVSTSAKKVAYPKPVTLTATVTGTDGGGTVDFRSDGVTIPGCATQSLAMKLFKYRASCAAALPGGQHAITADYSGDAKVAPSTGTLAGGELVTVATKLVAGPVTVTDPQGLPTYRAVLTTQADGTPIAGLTVTFALNPFYGTSSCSAVTDTSGVASCQGARPRRAGTYTAKWAGSTVYSRSSASSTVTLAPS